MAYSDENTNNECVKDERERVIEFPMKESAELDEITPLHLVIESSVNNKANVKTINEYGEIPLYTAKEENYTDGIDSLTPKTSRKRRYASNEQKHSVTSGSSRPVSWVSDYITWVKDSANGLLTFIGNSSFERIQSLFVNDHVQSSHNVSPEKQLTCGSYGSHAVTHYMSRVDFNGIVALFDVVVRKFTGEKYFFCQDESLSQLEVLGYVLNITQEFRRAIKQAMKESGISAHRLNINFIEVQEEVNKKVIDGRFDEVAGVLNSYVRNACSDIKDGKLSLKKINKFIAIFNNELLQISNGEERNVSLSKVHYIENQNFNLENKSPSNYLEGVSVQSNLTQVKSI